MKAFNKVLVSALALVLVGFGAMTAGAATVSVAATPTVVSDFVPAPGNDGYVFYATFPGDTAGHESEHGTDIVVLPSYVQSVVGNGTNYYSHNYSDITINGVFTATGINYVGAGGLLTTITLGASVPTSITLGVLADSVDDGGRGLNITVASGASSQLVTLTGTTNTNRFYMFDLTALSPFDVITISGAKGPNDAAIAGVTFDSFTTAVPEPATLSMVGLVGMGLIARRSRR
jgi:hypothetical protein